MVNNESKAQDVCQACHEKSEVQVRMCYVCGGRYTRKDGATARKR